MDAPSLNYIKADNKFVWLVYLFPLVWLIITLNERMVSELNDLSYVPVNLSQVPWFGGEKGDGRSKVGSRQLNTVLVFTVLDKGLY